MVSSGRRAAAVAIAIRHAARGRTIAVHVPDPHTDPAAFDLVVCLNHDSAQGPNVISLPTAVHDLTPAKLAEAADVWRDRLCEPGRPLIGVALGGAAHRRAVSIEQVSAQFASHDALRKSTGARLAITPSRRTSAEVRALLATWFDGDRDAFIWDMRGDNPYRGILALSDRLVVTSDSVSMVSEALATGASVEVFGVPGSPRHGRFIDRLIDQGLLRRFTGEPVAAPSVGPVNATDVAAEAVRKLLSDRLDLTIQAA